jgi:hypothetical protein
MSVQYAAVASQKFTWPVVTGALPEVTVAVSVTAVPEITDVTAVPRELTLRVVVDAGFDCAEAPFQYPDILIKRARQRTERHLSGDRQFSAVKTPVA